MWHIVYLTRNLINDKIYVGIHSTWNLNDGYFGSGKTVQKALKRYGVENFERIILHFGLSRDHISEIEKQIVNVSFISRNDTYNIRLGGDNENKLNPKSVLKRVPAYKKTIKEHGNKHNGMKRSDETKKKMSEWQKGKTYEEKYGERAEEMKRKNARIGEKNGFYQKKHTDETKRKVSEARKGKPTTAGYLWIKKDGQRKRINPNYWIHSSN